MIEGYDFSHHQTDAVIRTYLNMGPGFIFHKITEGSTYRDPQVYNRIKLFKGIPLLFYHYLRADKGNATGEVDNLVNSLNLTTLNPNQYGVAIDIEYSVKTGGTKNTDIEYVKRFMDMLSRKLKKRFIIYMPDTYSPIWYNYIREKDYGLWIARYRSQQPNHACDFWQNTSKPVDHDYFYGSIEKLYTYIGG